MVDRKIKPEPKSTGKKPPGRRAAAVADSSDEEDSPRERKRARKSNEDDEAEEKPDRMSEDDEDDGEAAKDGLIRDKDGYVMGSITRIACKNFVTYNHVEFTPGPALNMLIGPNGTGKSTIACAIAIGLGFPAKVLGRSTKLSAFVKTDATDETWIEIELKGRPGKKNLVVRRYIYKENDKSNFTLNGDAATAAEVADKMKDLNVQVSNLCTFLPQDRVASFSQMSQSELLVETQKAAGDRNLSRWHKDIIDAQKDQGKLQSEYDRLVETLKRMETRQADLDKDVKKAEQRLKLEAEIAVVTILIKYAEYDQAHAQWLEAKQSKNAATEDLKELKAANKPFEDSQAALNGIVAHYDLVKNESSQKARKLVRDIGKTADSLKQVESDSQRTRDNFDSVKKEEQDRKDSIAKLEREVSRLEAKIANPPERPDFSAIDAEMRAKSAEKAEIVGRITENQTEVQIVNNKLRGIVKDESTDKQRLGQLNNVKKQREESLRKFEPDAWKAVQWLRENKHRFKMPVHEPARLNVFSKTSKKEIVDIVEGPISLNAFKTFLFECQEDYDLMMREMNDKVDGRDHAYARINGTQIAPSKKPSDYPNAMNTAQLNAIGFDCFPIDQLEGPDAVLAWLANDHKLNRIPLQLTRRALDMQKIDNIKALTGYYTPDGSHMIKRSQYGQKNAQTEQRSLQSAKVLSGGMNMDRVQELEASLADHAAKKLELSDRIRELMANDNEWHAQAEALEQDRMALGRRREEMKLPYNEWAKARTMLDSKRQSLAKEKKRPSADAKRAELSRSLHALSERRIKFALQHKELTFKYAQAHASGISIHLRHLQAESDLRAMKSSALEKDQEIRDKAEELAEVTARTSALYHKAKGLMQEAQEADDGAEPETKTEVAKYRDENDLDFGALTARVGALEAEYAMTTPVEPGLMAKYQNRKQEIVNTRKSVEEAKETLDKATDTLTRVKDLWLPRLEELVSKISGKFKEAFDALGLLGEIQLGKHDDYAQWGIEILVAFRDDEPMKVLTAHRQSGGERALTTVMYLMSLAELAQAPFALVDEINQGMDQRVERNVHNALVKTTCKDDVGQYFLLTPKLLPDLEYHPLMKVLVIQAGTWLPDKLSLADVVKRRLKRKAAAIAT